MNLNEKRYSGCLHPMAMRKIGINPSGKPQYKFIGEINEILARDPDIIVAPCGHCINCRLAYSRKWADRLLLESQYHKQSWFVTLTYNDFFVPTSYYTDSFSGELIPHYSLFKRDVQLFLKRLRENTGCQFRYYCAGEYGSKTLRPHYHLIIFGLELNEDSDLYNARNGHSGFTLYQSRTIEFAWSRILFDRRWPLGHVAVAPCNWQTCAYVARYVTKKLDGELSSQYDFFNIEKPFSLMSRRPGIAYQYYLDHPEIADKGKVYLSTPDGSKCIRLPEYFLNKLELDFPEKFDIIKEERKQAAKRMVRQNRDTDLDFYSYLQQQERKAESTLKKLIRDEV